MLSVVVIIAATCFQKKEIVNLLPVGKRKKKKEKRNIREIVIGT